MKMTVDDREDYRFLKGKQEGIQLALGILNRRDVHPTSVQWLIKEKEIIEFAIDILEKKRYRAGEEE